MPSKGSRETLRRRITLAFFFPLIIFAAAFLGTMLIIGKSFIINSIYDNCENVIEQSSLDITSAFDNNIFAFQEMLRKVQQAKNPLALKSLIRSDFISKQNTHKNAKTTKNTAFFINHILPFEPHFLYAKRIIPPKGRLFKTRQR